MSKNKKSGIDHLVRPNIAALRPYSSARDEFKLPSPGDAHPGPLHAPVFLDANENSLGGPLGPGLSRYPDPQQRRLKDVLAERFEVGTGQIFLGNGSDEAIDLLMRGFVEPGRDNIVLMPPTYGMYAVQANIHGAEIRRAPLGSDFAPDAGRVRAVTDKQSKLLFLCSPNNPTGQCLPTDFILEMLDFFPGLVVIDEAYADFSDRPSWIDRLAEFPRLVVLRTLSKAWGLAGLRVGMAFAGTDVIDVLNRIKYPYNLSGLVVDSALAALEQEALVRRNITILLQERRRLATALTRFPFITEVFPSDANFLLVRTTGADALYDHLVRHGLVVRNRSRETNCENCLRITIGTPEENERLLEVLKIADG
jgi:histidinol-phosphate aminotransferase